MHRWLDSDAGLQARSGETRWASRIEQALDEDRFTLFAQRIAPLTGQHDGLHAEVLVRMLGTDNEVISPGAFFPAAERYQLAPRIDRWVLKHALDWLRAQAGSTRVRQLSVNLSGQSVGDHEFHRWAFECLSAAGEDCCRSLCPGPRILYVNAAFTRMTGYTPEEAIGQTPRMLQGPKTSLAACRRIREALNAWQPIRSSF